MLTLSFSLFMYVVIVTFKRCLGWGLTETSGFCAGGMLSTKQTDTVGSICAMSRLKVNIKHC